MFKEATHEEDEANELYRDVNVNLEGRDIVMTDAPLPNVQATQETEDTHVILTTLINPEGQQQSSSVSSGFVSNMLNPRPDTSIDLIFNTEATLLVDVPVTTIAEPPLVFATTLPLTPTSLITHMQQTTFPIPTTAPSTSLQDLLNFGLGEYSFGGACEKSATILLMQTVEEMKQESRKLGIIKANKTDSDNDGGDFVHPKFSTHNDEARQEDVDKEDSFDPRVQTPSHVESTNDEDNDEKYQV
ncbi:hypothetical protein Tco_0522283 [Tanacetum coccineum]